MDTEFLPDIGVIDQRFIPCQLLVTADNADANKKTGFLISQKPRSLQRGGWDLNPRMADLQSAALATSPPPQFSPEPVFTRTSFHPNQSSPEPVFNRIHTCEPISHFLAKLSATESLINSAGASLWETISI